MYKVRRNVHHIGEEMHGARDATTAKPAKHLLCSVDEKDNPDHQPNNGN
jgi:hypothetical protein